MHSCGRDRMTVTVSSLDTHMHIEKGVERETERETEREPACWSKVKMSALRVEE